MTPSADRRLPAWPPAAEAALGVPALTRLRAFGELLASDGVERGLIGPREVPRLWERHLLNSAALDVVLGKDVRDLCDVGSGAGLPGLVLALVRPDLQVALLEPLLRRTNFLTEAVGKLGMTNVEVIRARAEDIAGKRMWAAVTARAVAPMERLGVWCIPLVADHGELLAMKGTGARDEVSAAAATLRTMGAVSLEVLDIVTPGTRDTTSVVRVSLGERTPESRQSDRARKVSRR